MSKNKSLSNTFLHTIAVFNGHNQYNLYILDRTRKGVKFVFCIQIVNANKRLRNAFEPPRYHKRTIGTIRCT